MLLTMGGYEVDIAGDGIAALAASQAHAPDVVLLDIGLPGMDSYEVARRLRGLLPRKPLLLAVTGYGRDTDRQSSAAEGFDQHLLEPYDPSGLLRLLRLYSPLPPA
jgi:CheY-like chemotaxis protein